MSASKAAKALFCFIDDAAFELDNFRRHAAPAFARAEFVYAHTFAQAVEAMGGRRPVCFLLDLYGSDPELEPRLPAPEELEAVLAPPVAVAELYQGVESAAGEGGNLFLRRLYAQLQGWQAAFQAACEALGQGRAYGLANLAAAREHYPWAACLAYSRKALYADAVAVSAAGADGVLQKPQGADDAAIAQATRRRAPELARAAYAAVDRRLAHLCGVLGLRLLQEGRGMGLAQWLYEALDHLVPGREARPRYSRQEVAQALAGERLEDLGLTPAETGTVLALRRWLAA